MKRARKPQIKPRNPLVAAAIQMKAGAHRRKDKRAERARQREQARRQWRESE
ncbi:MAG: hypothetical protein KBD60_07045 [Sterolibacterium sp.]|jgi:hypothetical protein|nr:hypothetical protein [Sterolibacterium sp.]